MKAKKIIAVALAAAISVTAFAGCNSGGNKSSSGEKVTFSIFNYKIEAKEAFEKAIKSYEKANPNVSITMESVGGGEDYTGPLKAKLTSAPPALFCVGGPIGFDTYKDTLEDLSDQPWVSQALDGTLDDATYDGKVYGMPFALEGYGIVINRQMFEDAGVTYDSMLTFEGMKKGFDTLKEKIASGAMKEKYPQLEAVMEYPAKETWVVGDHDINAALAVDFKNAKEAFASDTLPFTANDAYKKMIDFQISYTKHADNPGLLNSVNYSQSLDGGLAIERVAAIEQGNWISPTVDTVDPKMLEKLDILPFPVPGYSEGKILSGVPQYWAVNKKVADNQKKAAKDFLNWLYQSDEGKKIIIQDAKFAPPFKNYDGLEPSDPLTKRVITDTKAGKATNGWVYLGVPSTWSSKVAGAAVQKYISGQSDWDGVIKTCKDQWEALRKSDKSAQQGGDASKSQ